MTVRAVCDTGPLIHLAEVDALSLLNLLDELTVPETVLQELDAGGRPRALDDLTYESASGTDRFEKLDAGESAALDIAAEREVTLLTDDLDARRHAKREGIEVHGTVGVVTLGYGREELDLEEAERLLIELHRQSSLFVSRAVVESGIDRLREIADRES